jgi:hypothetical protein
MTQMELGIYKEISTLYGSRPYIKGYYLVGEICDTEFPVTDTKLYSMLVNYYTTVTNGGTAPFYIAPYFINTTNPSAMAEWWDKFLPLVPNVAVLLPQDGVGVSNWAHVDLTIPYFEQFKKLSQKHRKHLWSTVEIFIKHPKYKPAPIERIKGQLLAESKVVESMVCFAFPDYMDPYYGKPLNLTKQLYNNYYKYINE